MAISKSAFTAVLSGFLWLTSPAMAAPQPNLIQAGVSIAPAGLADGAGVWLNMWNYPLDADAYCLKLNNNGIRNIFIQTSRSNTDAIANPPKLGELLDSAHRYKVRVIGWSFAELVNPEADAAKLIAAARFRSPNGEKLDAIAANLEKDLSAPKVELYSQKLRTELGEKYPMVAVVYSPLNRARQVATIPWKLLDHYYNVIAPMNYWNSKYARLEPFDYTVSTIREIRQLVGRPDVEVHVIGDGMGTHSDSIMQFLSACKTAAATSASLYPNQQMTEEQLGCLSKYSDYFPVNSRFRLAAFRDMVRRGELILSEKVDPSDAMQRGDFYRLIVRQIFKSAINNSPPKVAIKQTQALGQTKAPKSVVDVASMREKLEALDLSPSDALNILTQVGVVKLPSDTADSFSSENFLTSSITTREALDTVASAVEARDKLKKAISEANLPPQNRLIKNISNKAGRLFVQPAYAENAKKDSSTGRNLNYLDASQIVVQVLAGLK
jgi:hypothetical protein